jgi:hypothetical protein
LRGAACRANIAVMDVTDLERFLRDRLTDPAPDAEKPVLSNMVTSICAHSAFVAPVKEAQEKRRAVHIPARDGEPAKTVIKSFHVFTLHWRRLFPSVLRAAGEIAMEQALAPHGDEAALKLAVAKESVKLVCDILRESHEALSELESELVFALYSLGGNKPIPLDELTRQPALARWSAQEVDDALTKRLTDLHVVELQQDGWLLIETFEVSF